MRTVTISLVLNIRSSGDSDDLQDDIEVALDKGIGQLLTRECNIDKVEVCSTDIEVDDDDEDADDEDDDDDTDEELNFDDDD